MAYYLNATRDIYVRALTSVSAKRAYTYEEASWSLYLDVDKGESDSLSGYSRQMRIERTVLTANWQDITRMVWMLCTSDERQWTPQAARYMELAGEAYDKAIPARVRTAMQGKETHRPAADLVARLRGHRAREQQKPRKSPAELPQKQGPYEPETQPEQQKPRKSPAKVPQHTNTSSSSGSSPPLPHAGEDLVGDSDPAEIFAEVFPGQRLTIQQKEQIRYRVRDPDRYRQTLERWSLNYPHLPHQVGSQLERYERDEQHPVDRANEQPPPPPGGDGGGPPRRRRGGARGEPAEAHTFDGARQIAERAKEQYRRRFGGPAGGDAPGAGEGSDGGD